jgi:hypothetical protein
MTSTLDITRSVEMLRPVRSGVLASGLAAVLAAGLVPKAALGASAADDAPHAATARAVTDHSQLDEALRVARARGRVPAGVHLRGLRGHDTRLLRASTIRFMHRPVGAYAMGWVRRRINGVMTSLHDGTAGTFSALAAIQPGRRLAAATFANAGGRRGSIAVGLGLGELLADPVRSGRSGR